MDTLKPVHVMVGVLRDADGRVLIAERPPGKHMAGHWEFPGGKLGPDEAPWAGLVRELAEELGIEALDGRPFLQVSHRYPDRIVLLDTWLVSRFHGTPRGLDGQRLAWTAPGELMLRGLLEADRPIVEALLQRG